MDKVNKKAAFGRGQEEVKKYDIAGAFRARGVVLDNKTPDIR